MKYIWNLFKLWLWKLFFESIYLRYFVSSFDQAGRLKNIDRLKPMAEIGTLFIELTKSLTNLLIYLMFFFTE